jgi:hypothetical protein
MTGIARAVPKIDRKEFPFTVRKITAVNVNAPLKNISLRRKFS